MALITEDIDLVAEVLKKGNLAAIPTETVYGLAANALDETAVLKIFQVKERPFFDPLIVHTSSIDEAKKLVTDFPELSLQLAKAFWPGPLTLILPKDPRISDLVTSGLPNVGIRIPSHPLTLKLLTRLNFPLAAPSANPFNYVSPTTAEHVEQQLGAKIEVILNGGPSAIGVESTIVGIENNQPVIYRLGGIDVESIEAVAGKAQIQTGAGKEVKGPGMLTRHYSPRKPFYLNQEEHGKPVFIRFNTYKSDFPQQNQILLAPSGTLEEAARNLFAALRTAETMPGDYITAELVPDIGIGRAINDRLRRAAAKE